MGKDDPKTAPSAHMTVSQESTNLREEVSSEPKTSREPSLVLQFGRAQKRKTLFQRAKIWKYVSNRLNRVDVNIPADNNVYPLSNGCPASRIMVTSPESSLSTAILSCNIVYDYSVNVQVSAPCFIKFKDDNGDEYHLHCFRKGWHFVNYNSRAPTVKRVSWYLYK